MTNDDRKTNGADKRHLQTLRAATRAAINLAYAAGKAPVLRDWVENMSLVDRFEQMIDGEIAQERAHRRAGASFTRGTARYSIPVVQAATVLALSNIGDGALRSEPVTAEMFLTMRPGCAEALQVGYLARVQLAPLVSALCELDYAGAVK